MDQREANLLFAKEVGDRASRWYSLINIGLSAGAAGIVVAAFAMKTIGGPAI